MKNKIYKTEHEDFILYNADCFTRIKALDVKADMVFADPPYFLSNGGLTINSGKVVSVNKGAWDKGSDIKQIRSFNKKWLTLVRDVLKDNGTIWISGTYHNIFIIGQLLTELDFKILNVVTWEKNNPPPNFSCRFFTHSTELIIWARKSEKVPHYYNYDLMKQINEDKQMKDVWKLPAVAPFERTAGKHPTQKALSVLTRIILASTKKGDIVLDPFSGSSTTGIAANLLQRNFVGIEKEKEFFDLSVNRRKELDSEEFREVLIGKIQGFNEKGFLKNYLSDIGKVL
ncbi:DNA-methyltransferase [Myroides sp. LJL116]